MRCHVAALTSRPIRWTARVSHPAVSSYVLVTSMQPRIRSGRERERRRERGDPNVEWRRERQKEIPPSPKIPEASLIEGSLSNAHTNAHRVTTGCRLLFIQFVFQWACQNCQTDYMLTGWLTVCVCALTRRMCVCSLLTAAFQSI